MRSGLIVAVVYFTLALASAGIGVLGVSYISSGEEVKAQKFYRFNNQWIKKGAAGLAMIPIGFGGAIALVAVGVVRMRQEDEADEEMYDDDDAYEDED
ncbi:MAG: hypothetical protein AAFX99_15580 [Myxococcota bacterium]